MDIEMEDLSGNVYVELTLADSIEDYGCCVVM